MKYKALGRKLLFPPVWLIALLVVLSGAGLGFVFLRDLSQSLAAYPIYVLSFYTVVVLSLFLSMVFPKQYRNLKGKVYANPLGNRYVTDAVFRTNVTLGLSLGVNLLYAGVNGGSYFLYRSAWFAILAVYYLILAVMRYLLLRYGAKTGIGRDLLGELRRSRLCAMILMTLNLVLSGAVLMILYQDKGYVYHGVLIYVMALYTFYITIQAIRNLVKYRKYNSPVMSTAKVISLTSALVSMLSLETAMLTQFGMDMTMESKWIMVAATGAGVSLVVITMSLYLIARANQRIREIKENLQGEP